MGFIPGAETLSEGQLSETARAFLELDIETVIENLRRKVSAGVPAGDILKRDLVPGLNAVGERFTNKIYFLSDLVFASVIMEECMKILSPLLESETEKMISVGKLVIGTVKGDIHDIGKNIFKTLMRATGFEVHDLGIDVPAEKFIEKLAEVKPDILGMSALLATTAPYFKVVIDALKKTGMRDKVYVMIGGPPIVTAEGVGADIYCNDAFIGVKKALEYVTKARGA